MQRCMKEQRSIKIRQLEVIAKRDSMLCHSLIVTLAGFTAIRFSNPGQAWGAGVEA